MSTDKRPIEERIAALMGKSAWRALRRIGQPASCARGASLVDTSSIPAS